jgi:hypothetical protein
VGRVFQQKSQATPYDANAGDTFRNVVATECDQAADPKITCDEVALYNWGTNKPKEVGRALVELIGVRKWDGDDPYSWELDPARGIGKQILIPNLMKKTGLAYEKENKLKIKQQLPATAVGITQLDKWFLPSEEICDIRWQLEGVKARAKKLDFEVYASNYCKAIPNNHNDFLTFTYTNTPDVAILKKSVSANADERATDSISDWHGESEASDGILKPRGATKRYITAASSPYTVMLRYYENADHKKAILRIQSFWPRWSGVGAGRVVVADSLRIKWHCKDCPGSLQGQFLIYDKDFAIVWREAIPAGKCGNGDQEIDWSADGTPSVREDKMPYRVQIQLHTDKDTTPGFAVAGMHTEVRLFVDKDTHPLELDPYVATTDKISLDLSIADVYHKQDDPQRGEGRVWTKFALAKAGFHPGPVNDAGTNAHFRAAVKEFQRSVPKNGGAPGSFQRLELTAGVDNDATKDALANLVQTRKRPWFGRSADRSDWADTVNAAGAVTQEFRKDANFLATLRNPTERMIIWVDDRNWYTDFGWIDSSDDVTPRIRSIVTGDPADLGNLRGEYTARDLRVGYDVKDIARPWIPFQTDFRLLSKGNTLNDAVAAETDETKSAKIRKCIGPLRVDWSFDEIETQSPVNCGGANRDLPDLDLEVANELSGLYQRERNRTRLALRYALDHMKDEYDRVDIHKHSKYYNAPEACGGIRPKGAPATYFSKPFGANDESLRPCIAKDSAIQTVYTVIHDDLGQAAGALFDKWRGRAGVYFHPSRTAGDGYQVRAQVRFDQEGDYQFPNLETLRNRYPKLPQAQSTQFRLWRKTSIRGYIGWSPVNTWTGAGAAAPRANVPAPGPNGFRRYYTGCHVHITNELGTSNADLNLTPATLFDLAEYRAMVKQCLKPGDTRYGTRWTDRAGWISVAPTFWPWSTHNQFGITEASAANVSAQAGFDDLRNRVLNPLLYKYMTRVSLEMAKQIEKRKGWMRGHIILEFQTTPDAYYRRYQCKRCLDVFTFIQNATGPILAGRKCPTPGCGFLRPGRSKLLFAGELRAVPHFQAYYVCSNDATHTYGPTDEDSATAAGAWAGWNCGNAGCGGTLSLEQVTSELYRCNTCKFEGWYREAGAGARGSHQDQACPCLCGGQLRSRNKPLANQPRIEILDSEDAELLQYQSGGVPTPGLPSSSLGNPVGVALNFLGDTDLWGHEMAHCRHYEHAGNAPLSITGDPGNEHDRVVNTIVNWADPAINETDPVNQNWDRACLMTYVTDLPNYDVARDMPCFCYRCVLKNRGWKLYDGTVPAVASGPDVPGNVQDP